MYNFNYISALYRKNNFGQVCVWCAKVHNNNSIEIQHGILGHTITREISNTNRKPKDEVISRYNAKQKVGYKYLSDLKDNNSLPVEEELLSYLQTYLPDNRTTADNTLLPMLAKVYDDKVFNKCHHYIAQFKINGLRCFISAYKNNGDIFKPIRLRFQSREGTYWNSLSYLEDYLLQTIDPNFIDRMIEEHISLDGEVYIPGKSVNEIDHAVKNPNCEENKLVQYWCYDVAIEDCIQSTRNEILCNNVVEDSSYFRYVWSKETHLNNTNKLIILPTYDCFNDEQAVLLRDRFIDYGYEGLILRNPDKEYQYGKRNKSMIKFKASTDGKFIIKDIIPEGIKRRDIPLFVLKNDINNEVFKVHLSATLNQQREILNDKDKYIGKYMLVEYGERSGVNKLPFHIKKTRILC